MSALVSGYGTEGASSEASSVEAYGEANHVIGGYVFSFVFGVWQSLIGEVEGCVEFLGRHGRVGRIDDDRFCSFS